MKILSGKQQDEVEPEGLALRVRGRFPVHIDVGTGSGRLMLKQAGKNPEGFFIGMDPCAAGMHENAARAAKRGKKEGLDNLLFVIAPIEALPGGLAGIADIVTVILPWRSLRDGIVKADPLILGNLRKLGKPGSALEALVGYDERLEPHEMEKRALPALSQAYFHVLASAYGKAGIEIRSVEAVGNGALKLLESDWAKKLAYGSARTMYRLSCVYI